MGIPNHAKEAINNNELILIYKTFRHNDLHA